MQNTDTKFKITKKHLKLLKNACWENIDYVEFGGAGMDPKRPYGNSDVYGDIGDILNMEPKNVDGYERNWSEEQCSYMHKLHSELPIVLDIIFATGKIKTGVYERTDKYEYDWKKVKK